MISCPPGISFETKLTLVPSRVCGSFGRYGVFLKIQNNRESATWVILFSTAQAARSDARFESLSSVSLNSDDKINICDGWASTFESIAWSWLASPVNDTEGISAEVVDVSERSSLTVDRCGCLPATLVCGYGLDDIGDASSWSLVEYDCSIAWMYLSTCFRIFLLRPIVYFSHVKRSCILTKVHRVFRRILNTRTSYNVKVGFRINFFILWKHLLITAIAIKEMNEKNKWKFQVKKKLFLHV